MRPAEVKVTVLPPIDAVGWKTADVHSQADTLRARYLEVLGQVSEPPSAVAF